MPEIDLFNILLDQHYKNMDECLPYIKEGKIISPSNKNQPVPEGIENNEYKGICILKNGTTLLDRLIMDNAVKEEDVADPIHLPNEKSFEYFLSHRRDEDGVYVFDSSNRDLYRVCKIRYPNQSLEGRIPSNFVFSLRNSNGIDRDTRLMIGTKTRLAIELPQQYKDVNAYQIKRSSYTSLGMGKVVQFGSQGLEREFYFMYLPSPQGEIIGIERIYNYRDGSIMPIPVQQVTSRLLLATAKPPLYSKQFLHAVSF